MITSSNIKEYFDNLKESQINEVMEDRRNDVVMQIFVSNACVWFSLESLNIDDDVEEIQDNGGIVLDKDDFLRLYKESRSLNPFFFPYL